MSKHTKPDLMAISRVVFSGIGAYLVVHFLVLPRLISAGVTFPAYFYVGVVVTGILSVGFCMIWRRLAEPGAGGRPDTRLPHSAMHPAE